MQITGIWSWHYICIKEQIQNSVFIYFIFISVPELYLCIGVKKFVNFSRILIYFATLTTKSSLSHDMLNIDKYEYKYWRWYH